MRKTQRELIIEYMETFGSINPLDALKELGCFRLATRIFELKKMGYEIKAYQHKYKNSFGENKRYAVYYLKGSEFEKNLEE